MKKGATEFDKLCHRIFSAKGDGWDYYSRGSGVHCSLCGRELKAYYCEERLFMVECNGCKMKALVMAKNRREAVLKTFGSEDDRNVSVDSDSAIFDVVLVDNHHLYAGEEFGTAEGTCNE